MFKKIIDFLFPHGLVTPFGFLPPSGGSDASLAGGSIVSSAPEVTPSQLITGDVSSLGASLVRFNVGCKATVATGVFYWFQHPNFGILSSGRLSAQIVGPLTLQVTIAVADAAAPATLLSGWCAIMPLPPAGYQAPTTIDDIASLPGAVAVTVSPTITSRIILDIPVGIRTDLLVTQVVGREPILVYGFERVNIAHCHIVISGGLNLSGIGYWPGFFHPIPRRA